MRIEVWYRDEIGDGRAARLLDSLRAASGNGIESVAVRDVYIVAGVPGLQPARLVELVRDRVAQAAAVVPAAGGGAAGGGAAGGGPAWDLLLEVAARPGVTDPVATTLRAALVSVAGLDVPAAAVVQTARQYRLRYGSAGPCHPALLETLFNPLIHVGVTITAQEWAAGKRPAQEYPTVSGCSAAGHAGHVERFAVATLADDELAKLSAERLLALTLPEMRAVRAHYQSPAVRARRRAAGLGEAATDLELEMIAQTWSEHCKHKIFNATIEYREQDRTETIHSLFDTCIRATTRAVDPRDGFLRSVFHDNSGVIEFDDTTLLCFKAETHNSPSALDPYGGAITGIVGVNRDIIGTGRGARPLFNTNVLCFAPPGMAGVPRGLLPPRRVLEGVHRGIVDGGNQSGIPTVAGAFLFDPSFVGKPLVFCGTGGIMPAEVGGAPAWEGQPQAGDLAVMVGGRIGRDGIHGATFSSLALDQSSPRSAVQIGDPITQKKMSDFLLEARDQGLFRAITDNGAGGLSSSFGEMARACGGVRLELERAPLKYLGLAPWEILLSESQERMSLAVAPARYPALEALARRRDVEVAALGEFTADGMVEVRYAGGLVGLLDLRFLHQGLPEMVLRARWEPPAAPAAQPGAAPGRPDPPHPRDPPAPRAMLLRLLADPNVASKEPLVRQYDHEVQALTVGKPFVGVRMDGPSDGAVLQPRPGSTRGITVTHGICPWYSTVDPYHMAQCAVDEAVRAHVACGGDPDRMAALDNFCWPDPVAAPDNPDGEYKLGQLVRAARGLHDACVAYRLPLISGKDSMKNDAFAGGRRISVLPTLLVSVLGIVRDLRRSLSSDFKRAGDRIFVVGEDRGELRASAYARALQAAGPAAGGPAVPPGAAPSVDPAAALRRYRLLHRAVREELPASAHDVADGGLAVAAAESAIGGRLGARLELARVPARAVGPAAAAAAAGAAAPPAAAAGAAPAAPAAVAAGTPTAVTAAAAAGAAAQPAAAAAAGAPTAVTTAAAVAAATAAMEATAAAAAAAGAPTTAAAAAAAPPAAAAGAVEAAAAAPPPAAPPPAAAAAPAAAPAAAQHQRQRHQRQRRQRRQHCKQQW